MEYLVGVKELLQDLHSNIPLQSLKSSTLRLKGPVITEQKYKTKHNNNKQTNKEPQEINHHQKKKEKVGETE